jgi:hypothetical protein
MDYPNPEELLVKFQTHEIGLRRLVIEVLYQLIILTRLLDVLLRRHHALDQDIRFLAAAQNLPRPSQAHDPSPWGRDRQRQTVKPAPDEADAGQV